MSRNLDNNGIWEFEVVSNQKIENGKVDEKGIRVFAM